MAATLFGRQAFGPVHAVGAAILGEAWIGANEQRQSSRLAQLGELSRNAFAFGRAKMAINNSGAARQPPHCRYRIGDPFRIREKVERRNRRTTGIAIEPCGGGG